MIPSNAPMLELCLCAAVVLDACFLGLAVVWVALGWDGGGGGLDGGEEGEGWGGVGKGGGGVVAGGREGGAGEGNGKG